ncbi:MAG TPA: undecaprenyl-diphosphate phosphatase [Syntrophomonadaceae bacterium]|nr:undecaprenyl-diphosphate phosphatase [Syntrophomonadaceae bacterium]
MTSLQAIFLGIVQGLTEFLPVSSSGHLVIFQHVFGIEEGPLTFDILVHLGTLVAVIIAFWDDVVAILRKPFSRMTYLIIIGCIPAALMGFYLEPLFTKAFESLLVVGIGLLITGFILKISDTVSRRTIVFKELEETTTWNALFIGLLQGIAIIPGISRSGSTIAGGLLAGLDREWAARYSFLLSIPVILGAGLVHIKRLVETGIESAMILPYIIGPITACIFGYIAIRVVMTLVKDGRLVYFSYYCWTVGLLTLAYVFFG